MYQSVFVFLFLSLQILSVSQRSTSFTCTFPSVTSPHPCFVCRSLGFHVNSGAVCYVVVEYGQCYSDTLSVAPSLSSFPPLPTLHFLYFCFKIFKHKLMTSCCIWLCILPSPFFLYSCVCQLMKKIISLPPPSLYPLLNSVSLCLQLTEQLVTTLLFIKVIQCYFAIAYYFMCV